MFYLNNEQDWDSLVNKCVIEGHKFPDTGLLKSWCKVCEIEGEFNKITCKYEPIIIYGKTANPSND